MQAIYMAADAAGAAATTAMSDDATATAAATATNLATNHAVVRAFEGLFHVVHAPTATEHSAATATANKSLRVILFAMGE